MIDLEELYPWKTCKSEAGDLKFEARNPKQIQTRPPLLSESDGGQVTKMTNQKNMARKFMHLSLQEGSFIGV